MARDKFNVVVERSTVNALLEHFGPDPVTRAWCVGAYTLGAKPYVREILDESKEAKGKNVKLHILTDRKIQKGLAVMVAKYPHHLKCVFDLDHQDAPSADLFVQCCIFGEEKYA